MTKRSVAVGAGVALAFGLAACNTDKLTDINQNPNNPEDVPAATLFTSASRLASQRWFGGFNYRATEFLIQHMAEAQYPDEDRYARLGAGQTEGYFTGAYPGELEDFQKVINKGRAAKQPGVYAPALVMRTWDFAYLTNSFGDIPYFEALRGDSLGATVTPKYDAQKDIYADFFKTLDQASKDLSNASGDLGRADPIYGGDTRSWQRFSNSLRARLALLLVNVDPTTASAQLAAAFTAPGGTIDANGQNARLAWPGDGVYNQPIADFFKTRDDNRMSQTLMNLLSGLNDPRIAVYAQPLPGTASTYAGMPNGLTASAAGQWLNKASRIGAGLFPGNTAYGFFGGQGASFPSFIFTAAEMNFIKAEAAERGLGGLTASQARGFYEAGIRASMQQWGVPASAIDAYLASAAVSYKGGVDGQKQIAQQKYIALFMDGGTAWFEWRRTCQPGSIVPGPAATAAEVPRRFMYAPTEYSVNATQVRAAVAAQGGTDAFNTRMYIDKSPSAAPTFQTGCGQR